MGDGRRSRGRTRNVFLRPVSVRPVPPFRTRNFCIQTSGRRSGPLDTFRVLRRKFVRVSTHVTYRIPGIKPLVRTFKSLKEGQGSGEEVAVWNWGSPSSGGRRGSSESGSLRRHRFKRCQRLEVPYFTELTRGVFVRVSGGTFSSRSVTEPTVSYRPTKEVSVPIRVLS